MKLKKFGEGQKDLKKITVKKKKSFLKILVIGQKMRMKNTIYF